MHYMLPAPYCDLLYHLPLEQRQHADRNLPLSLNGLQGITKQNTERFINTCTEIFSWSRGREERGQWRV
jgi:hypothetical protein